MSRRCLCVSGARAKTAERAADGGKRTSTGCSKRETHTGILTHAHVRFIKEKLQKHLNVKLTLSKIAINVLKSCFMSRFVH